MSNQKSNFKVIVIACLTLMTPLASWAADRVARPLAVGFAAAFSTAPPGPERQGRPYPKQSAPDVVALASDPNLWDKMAPFQSVYAQPSPEGPGPGCVYYPCPCKTNNDCQTTDPCVTGKCDKAGGGGGFCVNVPTTGGTCNDSNVCTTNDTCSNGICVGAPITGGSCDDRNVCTTNDTCSNGTCVGIPVMNGTSCPGVSACTSGTCSNGTCIITPITGTSCDDHNACTMNDTCSNGTCVGVPLPDGTSCGPDFCSSCVNGACIFTCDDFNMCTVDSCDLTSGLCAHSPISCDDGSPCTADSCDPAIGCVHFGLPEEAGPLVLMGQVTLEWGPALGSSIYNTYRGTIPAGGLGSRSPVYDHVCFESDDAQLNGPQTSVDVEDPPVGTSFYYLVDGESSCGDGPLGVATDGTPEMPTAFCPTPP